MNGGDRYGRAGFTLIELLVVMGVIAMLLAISIPAYNRMVERSRAAACLSNLRQIGIGLQAWLNDSEERRMPVLKIGRDSLQDDVPVIDNTFNKYLTDLRVFACPGDTKGLAERTGTSYCWNVALNDQPITNLNFLQMVTDSSRIPVISDKEGFHPYLEDKVNILYADGHVTKDVKFFTDK